FISGIIIGKLKVENLVYDFSKNKNINQLELPSLSWEQRLIYARNYTFDIVKKVWLFVVIGIGIGAWIHGYVPADLIAKWASGNNWYSVPLAVLIGIPLYSNAAGIVPIVSVLIEKGASLGTALAFMMAVIGLSLPEMIILRKVLKLPLIFTFIGVVGTGIMIVGYLFNFIF
ncbi:MAG: permease, partial [Bacteroidia bacterium]|nr:permease [Bacteroidia bacterium]